MFFSLLMFLILLQITPQWKMHDMAENCTLPCVIDTFWKVTGPEMMTRLERKHPSEKPFSQLSQWQGDEDVQELRVSELQESSYYAIWQDDSARVSGSEGELIRLPSDSSAFEECLIFQWSSARIPMRDSHSSGCLRKDIVLPDDLNQCCKLSFHLAGPPRHNN